MFLFGPVPVFSDRDCLSVVVGLYGPLKVFNVLCPRKGDSGGVLSAEKSGEALFFVFVFDPTFNVSAEFCRTLEYIMYTYNPITRIYKIIPLGPPIADKTFETPDVPAVITVAVALEIDPTTASSRSPTP